jgi:hypothetical protein
MTFYETTKKFINNELYGIMNDPLTCNKKRSCMRKYSFEYPISEMTMETYYVTKTKYLKKLLANYAQESQTVWKILFSIYVGFFYDIFICHEEDDDIFKINSNNIGNSLDIILHYLFGDPATYDSCSTNELSSDWYRCNNMQLIMLPQCTICKKLIVSYTYKINDSLSDPHRQTKICYEPPNCILAKLYKTKMVCYLTKFLTAKEDIAIKSLNFGMRILYHSVAYDHKLWCNSCDDCDVCWFPDKSNTLPKFDCLPSVSSRLYKQTYISCPNETCMKLAYERNKELKHSLQRRDSEEEINDDYYPNDHSRSYNLGCSSDDDN